MSKNKLTNGDKIIAGGMRALAEFARSIKEENACQYCQFGKNVEIMGVVRTMCAAGITGDCADGIEAYLNAPAESEVEDD